MATYSITISDAEEKALLHIFETHTKLQAWLDNSLKNKARQCLDEVLREQTTLRPDLLTHKEKETEIRKLSL